MASTACTLLIAKSENKVGRLQLAAIAGCKVYPESMRRACMISPRGENKALPFLCFCSSKILDEVNW
jgi:hypothetical protein